MYSLTLQHQVYGSNRTKYWQELAKYNPIKLETPIKHAKPQKYTANDKILNIYKKLNPDFADQIKGDDLVDENGDYDIFNKWNGHTDTGTIAHLIQLNNSLGAEIDIAAQATVSRTDLVYGEPITNMITLCGDASSYGNVSRNSDPTVSMNLHIRRLKLTDAHRSVRQ